MGVGFLKGGSFLCRLLTLLVVAFGRFGLGASVSSGRCEAVSAVRCAVGGGVYRSSVS